MSVESTLAVIITTTTTNIIVSQTCCGIYSVKYYCYCCKVLLNLLILYKGVISRAWVCGQGEGVEGTWAFVVQLQVSIALIHLISIQLSRWLINPLFFVTGVLCTVVVNCMRILWLLTRINCMIKHIMDFGSTAYSSHTMLTLYIWDIWDHQSHTPIIIIKDCVSW